MLDYGALAALGAVLREGSFDKAAQALNVTPSAVSQRIKALEERVGATLVVRGQPCTATEVGRRLCQHLDHVRLLEHDLQRAWPGLAPQEGGRVSLSIAVNADSLATWAGPALARFGASHPVLLAVQVDDQDHTRDSLRSGAVMAAVTASATPVAGCNSRALGTMRYVAAASPAFIAQHFAGGVHAASLAQAPSLVFDTKDALQDRWVRRLCRRHVELPRHVLPSAHAFVMAAEGGMGWGLHAEALIADSLRRGRLRELVPGVHLDVKLYWQHARAGSSVLEGLTSAVLQAATQALHRP